MHVGNRGSGDSKKAPTKCIIHGQAGNFLLTFFFFYRKKKNSKSNHIIFLKDFAHFTPFFYYYFTLSFLQNIYINLSIIHYILYK